MASANILTLNDANFQTEISSATVPVLVDFWAEWCGPCRMLGPILDQIADEKGAAYKITKVNVDESPNTAAQFNVRAIPMMAFFKNGQLVDTITGVQSKDAIVRKLESL